MVNPSSFIASIQKRIGIAWAPGLGLGLGLALTLAAGISAAPLEPGNQAWNVNRNPNGSNPAAYFGEWPGHAYHPSADDWRKQSVYQFITDRFADGNPDNNDGKYGGYDLGTVGTRHGGDFKGITERLDYIKSMGYTAIWVSPVFQNRSNSYHGYGQIDFTVLDDRFGTVAEMREMVDAAHARGIYVFADIIVNHMSDLYYFEGRKGAAAPFKMHTDEYKLLPWNANETYRDFRVDNTKSAAGTYPPVYAYSGWPAYDNSGLTGSFWNSDFHHNGDLADYGNAWENHLGKIYGTLDDLRTDHPRVQDKIIAMTKSLISTVDIDGIRMDTPMQVPLDFFQAWAPAVRAHAASLGKSDFLIFGEYYCPRERAATMTGRGKTPDMYNRNAFIDNSRFTLHGGINYPMYWWFGDAIRNQADGHLGEAKALLDSDKGMFDFFNPARNEFRYSQVNFYNNHDQWRMSTAADGFKKTDLGSAIIAFWPGIPAFYYGDEQGFKTNGTALDGWGREDMMTSLAWKAYPTVNGRNPCETDNFDMANPHYQWVQKLMNVRRQYPALQTSDELAERWKQANNGNGIYAYSRIWGLPKDWTLVAWNTWKDPLSAGGGLGTFYTGWSAGDVIVNVLNPAEKYTLGTNGTLASLSLAGYETKVFARQDNLKRLDPVVTMVTPAHDQRLTAAQADWIARVRFSEDMDVATVKDAFRYDDQPVDPSRLTWDPATRQIEMALSGIPDGIHTLRILEIARTITGRALYGSFRSRFRKGGDDNVIANPAFTADANLISVTDAATGSVILTHRATGARKLRVKNEGGAWSAWSAYQPQTAWTLASGSGTKKVTVQYWADNSAAYFVNGQIGFAKAYAQVYFRGTPNAWAAGPMTLVADNLWKTTVTTLGSATERFKFDIKADWTLNFGDDNLDFIADQGGADIRLPTGRTVAITFNDKTRAYTVTVQ
ncbi:MAG: symbB [Fibrobacteres bacterium]|nr:symbB [Fibrobacterota bacterium]